MKNIKLIASCALVVSLASCVPYPGMQSAVYNTSPGVNGAFKALGPGSAHVQSQHFFVETHGQDAASKDSSLAESIYNSLMIDAGLMTFQPANGYKIIIYQNNAEFMKKTGQPAGSRGVIFRGGLYTYAGKKLDRRLAYEITQLVISSYINRPNPDWLWVKDGLAAYEEVKMVQEEGYQQDFFALVQNQMRQNPTPIAQLTTTPPPEGVEISNSAWHCQAESMVAFMITQTGSSEFGQFLGGLQSNLSMDTAISQAFQNKWSNLDSFYQAWLQRG